MFLLILLSFATALAGRVFFTFHNVSINTEYNRYEGEDRVVFTFHNVSINTASIPFLYTTAFKALHSTMFLLIHLAPSSLRTCGHIFTFHNVSINTERWFREASGPLYFTFHNVSINTYETLVNEYLDMIFTFHNVSINTRPSRLIVLEMYCFTFHNVSINTLKSDKKNAENKLLYIPQCFY